MTKIKYIPALFIVFITSVFQTEAQTSNALYFMQSVPQSTWLNPANNPKCKFSMGFTTNLALQNNVFSPSKFIKYDPGIDSMVTILGSRELQEDFLTGFGNNGFIELGNKTAFHFGFRVDRLYLSFEAGLQGFARNSSLTGGIFNLAINEGAEKESFDIGAFDMDVLEYAYFGVRGAYDINSDLTAGIRIKRLYGITSFNSNTDVNLTTGVDEWVFDTDLNYQFSTPFISDIANFGQAESIDSLDFISNDNLGASDFLSGSKGWSFDLGANYKITDRITVGASVIDLGAITWNNAYQLNFKGDLTQGPVEIDINNIDSISIDILETLTDSLLNSDDIKYSNAPYKTWLPTSIYLSGNYQLNKLINFGLVSRTTFSDKTLRQSFTGSVNLTPLRGLSTTLAYSYQNKSFNNFAFALQINPLFPPLPLWVPPYIFIMVDNITFNNPKAYGWEEINESLESLNGRIPVPVKQKAITFHIGLNWQVGCRDKGKKGMLKKDSPLLYY